MDQNEQVLFTPAGGMNQDDSLISPSANNAGKNAFQTGDYRYAANVRIGSSRNGNFGDVEDILSTVQVTGYLGKTQGFENPNFDGGLSGWSFIDVDGATEWTYDAGAKSEPTVFSFSDIMYQTIASGLSTARLNYTVEASFGFTIVFLDGTSVISTQSVSTSFGTTTGTIDLVIPANCDGIGFQTAGTLFFGTVRLKSVTLFYEGTISKPAGTEKVIGVLRDDEFLKIYYCVWNSNEDDTIRCYDKVTNTITELIRRDMGWSDTTFVSMAKLDNWMALTDRVNRPRLIDVDTIADLFLSLDTDFREYHLSFHKWAPLMPPTVRAYWDGVTDNRDKFKNKTIQFSYRYVYKGKLRSRWSPSSAACENFSDDITTNDQKRLTSLTVSFPGCLLDDPSADVEYNYFNHDDIKFTNAVEAIEFAYRLGENDLWRKLKTIAVSTSGNQSFSFIEGGDSSPIPQDDFYQLFDTVPFLAGTVEAIDNKFFFGDCLNEHDPSVTPIITDISVVTYDSFPNPSSSLNWNSSTNDQATASGRYTSLTAENALNLSLTNLVTELSFKSRGIYKVGIQFMDRTGWISAVYTNDEWSYTINEAGRVSEGMYALCFKFEASFKPPEWAVAYQILVTNCLNIDSFMIGVCNKIDTIIDVVPTFSSTTPDSIKNRINTHFENNRLITGTEFSDITDNLSKNRLWRKVLGDIRETIVSTESLSNIGRLYIDINNWYNSSKKNAPGTQNNPMNNLYYNYRDGDRVRFLGSDVSSPLYTQKKVYDVLILEFTGSGIVIEKPDDLLWIPGKTDAGDGPFSQSSDQVIEVYTPKVPNEEDFIFYERGEWYPVLHPLTDNRDWSKSDWTYTNNAAVTSSTYGDITVYNKFPFNKGDCHVMNKSNYYNIIGSSTKLSLLTTSMNHNVDETYERWERGNGRPNISYVEYPVKKFNTTQVRFGGNIIENSNINNLNRFRSEDQNVYPSEYGRIRALIFTANAQVESVGSILLAIGEREAWSIYVNRTTLEDLSGNTQVSLSDKVLGSYNTLLGSHGTFNPESVSKEKGNVYWWDALDGSWIRYGRNGLTEISYYKMRNWFRELSALLLDAYQSSTPPLVISEFDPFNEEVITHMEHSALPATFRGYSTYKGAVFSEADTRWKETVDYHVERFARLGTQLYSFKGGDIFKHEAGEDHRSFHGTLYDCYIEPVFTYPIAKVWETIMYIGTDKWSVERLLSEYRGLKNKQMSTIPLTSFDEREDAYWADIKRDENTVNTPNALLEGQQMRSRALQVLLKLDPSVTHLTLLHYVAAGWIVSEKNK
jgi:hypothetical protein